jgi:hypothetical protein
MILPPQKTRVHTVRPARGIVEMDEETGCDFAFATKMHDLETYP